MTGVEAKSSMAAATQVVHLSTLHDRDDVRIFHKQCKSLVASDYQVSLLVADGLGSEIRDGVSVVDIGRRPTGRLGRMLLLPWLAFKAVKRLRPAVLHFHDPELLPMACVLAMLGTTVVYDVHEDVPQQILAKYWIPAWLRPSISWLFLKFEGLIARRLQGVVVANPPNLARFKALGCDAICVNNFPLLSEFPELVAIERQPRTIAYVGGLTRVRGIVELVQAMALMPDVQLLLCGRFTADGAEAACRASEGWHQVSYLGQLDRQGVQEVLARASIGMVTLLPEPNYLVALPVKMFEYMAAGLPVVASNIPLWQEILQTHRCGVGVDPSDPSAIAQAVRDILLSPDREEMGLRGREAVLTRYHWQRELDGLLALYARLTSDSKRAGDSSDRT